MHSEAAEILANALEQDALAHESGKPDEIGMQYDPVLAEILPIDDIPPVLSALAFNFWDGWLDSKNHDWLYYEPMTRDDWPRAAREIAKALRSGVLPDNPAIIEQFIPKPRPTILNRFLHWVRDRA